ncbi:uncharacterized protein LOC126381320 [Pectinophora gossypiella]|uniref:uncharacterized protein LOC126381320 n=1 Tax=Pectinophora gossypiella TaxID=13191 RepID=UPI00214E227A|nr:uncharacterized protein LOC126381320 [Pectinophora gossypiella]
MSDSEFEVIPKQGSTKKTPAARQMKRSRAPPSISSIDQENTKKKAKTHDIFELSHGRPVGNEGSDKRIVSYFVNKVANGSERRTTSLDGEYVVDLKIYHANDVNNTDSREVWRKALLRIKLQTPDDSDEWKLLQKLVTRIDKNFEDEPRFYSDKHVD